MSPSAKVVVLDSGSPIIDSVQLLPGNQELEFSMGASVGDIGEAVKISLPEKFAGGDFKLRIFYTTGLKAAAFNWLDEGDTTGGKMPYMYTMC